MKWHKKIERWINKRTMADCLDWYPLTGDLIQVPGGELWEIEDINYTPTVPPGFLLRISLNGQTQLYRAMTLRIKKQLPDGIRIWRKLIIAEQVLRAAGMATHESYYRGSPPSLDIVEELVKIDQFLRTCDSDIIANLLAQSLLTLTSLCSVAIVSAIKQIEQQNWVDAHPASITRFHLTLPSSKKGKIALTSKEYAQVTEQIKHKFCQYLETQPNWVSVYKDVEVLSYKEAE